MENKKEKEKIIQINQNTFALSFSIIILTNFFYNNLIKNKPFKVFKNSRRNLLDIDDAIKNCLKIIKINKKKNKIINLLNRRFYTPLQIVSSFEKILKKKVFMNLMTQSLGNGNLKVISFFLQKITI